MPLALVVLSSCSSEPDPPPGPSPEAVQRVADLVRDAATAAGDSPTVGSGGDAHQTTSVRLGGVPADGGTRAAWVACTGGSDLDAQLAGAAITVDCDGQAHRVEGLVPDGDTVVFEITRPSDVDSVWALTMTSAV
ncbi:hypothetical protein GCM10027519_15530 [Kineococcus endophyticus]